MIGVPQHVTDKYIRKLINLGYHVIRIDQVTKDDPPKRKVVGIYSATTNVDYADNYNDNHLRN